MRNAETVLGIIRDRGRRGLPLEDVYRQLFNPELYLLAYGRISRNAGAMTPGATAETVDGMSLAKIGRIIDALRHETYRWTPVRRVYIEKKGSTKKRPLGIPTWSDKLLQEVIRLILEAYYEPQFSPASHGFRPARGCHTALGEIYHRWVGTKWFIEGDIARMLRHPGPRGPAVDPAREDPRQPLPAVDREPAPGRIPGGLALQRHAERQPARRGGQPDPLEHLPGPAGSVRRDDAPPEVQPRRPTQTQPGMDTPARASDNGWRRRAAGTRPICCAARCSSCRPSTRPTRPTAACATSAMPTTCCSASAAHDARPRRSSASSAAFLRDEPQAGTVRDQDADHPRAVRSRALPRLRHRGPAQRPKARPTRSPEHQRPDRAARARRTSCRTQCARYLRHGEPMHRPELVHDSAFSIVAQYQREYRGVVEYYRQGLQPPPAQPPEVDDGAVADPDAGAQAAHQRLPGLPPLRRHVPDRPRPVRRAPGRG